MSGGQFQVVQLDGAHERSEFHSGPDPLDSYFKQQVSQDVRRRVTACYVALTDHQRIAGYYTLASASVLLSDLPVALNKKLPRYPTVPAIRMGRLAVDMEFKGMGLGGALLADALTRSVRSEIAAYALLVDAKDQSASAFYKHHGLVELPSQPLKLFMPPATVAGIAPLR
jgi:ribosomal protein S18 acetylase RimI-like enzyme